LIDGDFDVWSVVVHCTRYDRQTEDGIVWQRWSRLYTTERWLAERGAYQRPVRLFVRVIYSGYVATRYYELLTFLSQRTVGVCGDWRRPLTKTGWREGDRCKLFTS